MSAIASIDIGSNAFRMETGRPVAGGKLEIIDNIRLPVRLGKDVFSTGVLSEETMQKAVDAFLHFKNVAALLEVSNCRVVATSAMREAANGQVLVERIARETGFQVEIISGEEEARLVHLAVRSSMDLAGKTALLIDIGGGSVEVLVSAGEAILSSASYDLGTVRLLHRAGIASGQASPAETALRETIEAARKSIAREIGSLKIDLCVGTGGNLEEMGRLRKSLLKEPGAGFVALADLEKLIQILGGMSVEERMQKVKLNPDRADVILPAMIVLQMIAREAHASKVHIPGVGLKDGVLYDMFSQTAPRQAPRQTQVQASIQQMGAKFAYDAEHAGATARLAERLFDQSLSLHNLAENERLLLSVAARLHDVGHYINTIQHEKHGYYLLMNHNFIGLSEKEREIAANVIYYHRRGEPSPMDENFRALSEKDRQVVTKLAAILRIADALDTGHRSRVEDVILEQEREGCWQLYLVSTNNGMLEDWAFEKRKALFEGTFQVTLKLAGYRG